MVQELKGRNGKIVGSKEYFKTINQSQYLGTLMRGNQERWDYYAVLGGSSSKVKQMLTGQTGNQIKTSLNNIARILKDDIQVGRDGQNYSIAANRKRIREVLRELGRCGLNGLSSLEANIVKLTFLEGFDGKPIIIPDKYGSGNPINVKLEYKGNITNIYITANVSYLGFDLSQKYGLMTSSEFNARKQKVVQGIKKWEGNYTVFDGQKVRVYMNVVEKKTTFGAIKINMIKGPDFLSSINFTYGGDQKLKQPLALPVVFQNTTYLGTPLGFATSIAQLSGLAPRPLSWAPDSAKIMVTTRDEVDLYKHEFGHVLGLGDAYQQTWAKYYYDMKGINPDLYRDLASYPKTVHGNIDMVMNYNGTVQNHDIEMVLLAFSTGKRQNYQEESKGWLRIFSGSGEVSTALGRGN